MRPKLGEEKLWPHDPAARKARAAELRRLYVDERKSTPEIGRLFGVNHKSVQAALKKAGIATRRKGPTSSAACIEAGCNLPIYRVRHKTNGSWYGRRCRLHWIVFRMLVNQRYNDKTIALGKDEAWLRRMRQLLARIQRTNREVSQSLKRESPRATTSPAACRL